MREFVKRLFITLSENDVKKDLSDKTKIHFEMPLEDKIEIINRNNGNKAIIKQPNSEYYLQGTIEFLDKIAFKLKISQNITEETKNYYLPVFYNDPNEILVYSTPKTF